MKMRSIWAVAVMGWIAVNPSEVLGQPGPDQMNRQELLQRIQERFQEELARELELTPAQSEALPGVMAEFAVAREALTPVRRAFIGRVHAHLATDGSEAEALALIEEGRALRAREEALLVREEERLLEILDPRQVLLLQQLRDQFEELIRAVGNRDAPEWFSPGGRGFPGPFGNPRP